MHLIDKDFVRSGRETLLDDDFTDEQVDEELAPLNLQIALVDALLGSHTEALQQLEVRHSISMSSQTFYHIAYRAYNRTFES